MRKKSGDKVKLDGLNFSSKEDGAEKRLIGDKIFLVICFFIIFLWLAALIYFLYPRQNGSNITVVMPPRITEKTTIKYISNQPLKDTGYEGEIFRLNNIIAEFTRQTGVKVERIETPSYIDSYIELSIYFRDILKSDKPEFDVVMIDGPWIGMFAPYMLDLNSYFEDRKKTFFSELINNAMVDGKLTAIPYFQDMTVLFYRTDLLEKYGFENPPQTWDELEEMAKVIQDGERKVNSNFWGYIWSANESEALTCTALGLQASFGGGTMIENNEVTINNPKTIKAFDKAKNWIGVISPISILQSEEDDIIAIWEEGNAAFMQNWPGASQIDEDADIYIAGKYKTTSLPSGGVQYFGVYGGEYLGVDKRTKHPAEVALFLRYMSGLEVQKKRAIKDGWLPVLPDLYNDPEFVESQEIFEYVNSDIFSQGISRPGTQAGENYNQVSQVYFTIVHEILAGNISIEDGLAELEKKLMEITGLSSANK